VCRRLGVVEPALYVKYDQAVPLTFMHTRSGRALIPVLVAGVPLLGDRRRSSDLTFLIARSVARLRPERILRLALPDPAALGQIIQAAIALANSKPGSADDRPAPRVARTVEALKQLPPVAFDQVVMIGERFSRLDVDPLVMARTWLEACDLTAARVALALAGDLDGALRLVAADETALGEPRARVLDLVWSSTTDEFLLARERLLAKTADRREPRRQPLTA
jgi:hypothetical protein